ncbi:MAG: DUF1538 domain-containing protein [Methanomassiliicoccales archaeon]
MSETDLLSIVLEVIQAILPLVAFFLIFQVLYLKFPKSYLLRLLTGLMITSVGMVLFLKGVFMGFLPAGEEIGLHFANQERWLLIPIGAILGFLATFAEPAVRVLCDEIEKSSSGMIKAKIMLYTLSLGVGVLVAVGMAKIAYGIDFLYIIVPGYLLVLVLLWLTDGDFIAISFDSGGVATGPMAVTFLMSMGVGFASGIEGGNPVVDGFGLIALIALAPIIFVLGLGVLIRMKRGEAA